MMNFGKLLLIGVGGFTGSILRYIISGGVQAAMGDAVLPYGTLAVNATGCFAIGFFSHLVETLGLFDPGMRAFVVIGVLGGYTTFSAFGNETLNLLRDGERLAAAMTVGANVGLGIGAVWLGRVVAHLIWGR